MGEGHRSLFSHSPNSLASCSVSCGMEGEIRAHPESLPEKEGQGPAPVGQLADSPSSIQNRRMRVCNCAGAGLLNKAKSEI